MLRVKITTLRNLREKIIFEEKKNALFYETEEMQQ